jgi:hypothetical protein
MEGAPAARPSARARAKLRRAVAEEFAPERIRRRRVVAGAAALLVAAGLALMIGRAAHRAPLDGDAAAPQVDSARSVPASLNVL